MSAAAVISIRRRQLIRTFRDARATDEEHAITLERAGQRHSWIFEQMARRGVFVAAEQGRYFMNEQAAHEFQAACRKRAFMFTGVLLAIFVVLWLAGWLAR